MNDTEPAVVRVRDATRADVPALATVLSRAFQVGDPVSEWLFPDPERRRRRQRMMFAALVRAFHLRPPTVHLVESGGVPVAAAVWDPPGGTHRGGLAGLRAMPGLLRALGRRLPDGAAVDEAFAAATPERPHWHLAHLGVDPEHQGRGAGTALLAAGLARCDHDGVPAYLECKRGNVDYYRRFGFAARDDVTIGSTGPTLCTMLREPADRHTSADGEPSSH